MSEIKRQWCAMLAKLVAPMDAARAAAAFVAMLPVLPPDDACYSTEAALRIARADRRTSVPLFADIEKGLLAERSHLEVEIARLRLPGSLTSEQAIIVTSAVRWFDRGGPADLVRQMLENEGSKAVIDAFRSVRPNLWLGFSDSAGGSRRASLRIVRSGSAA